MSANNHPKESMIIDKEENIPSKEQQNAQTSTTTGGDGGNSNSVDEFSSRDEQNIDLEMTFETSKNHPKESTNNEVDNPSQQQKKIPTNTSIDGYGEHNNVNDENTNTENQKLINNTDDKLIHWTQEVYLFYLHWN